MSMKRKAYEVFEQQAEKSKVRRLRRQTFESAWLMCFQRSCVDHGIKVADVKSFVEDTPTEKSSQSLPSSPSYPTFRAALPPARLDTSKSHRMETRTTKRYNTYKKVLNTGELLEKIIFELPPSAIVKLRRVNKTWNHIIMTLPCIRKKIFLDAEPLTDVWIFDSANSVLRPYTEALEGSGSWPGYKSHCTPAILNPMLFARDDNLVHLLDRARICEKIRFIARPDMQIPFDRIYHDMYVTQPPVKSVEMDIRYQDRDIIRPGYRGPLRTQRMLVENEEGVKFRDMLDEFERLTSNATAWNWSTPRNLAFRVNGADPEKRTKIYMLGAIFVTDAEKAAVEKLGPCEKWEGQQWPEHEKPPPPSPEAKALIKKNCGKAIDFRPKIDRLQDQLDGLEWYQRRYRRLFGYGPLDLDDD